MAEVKLCEKWIPLLFNSPLMESDRGVRESRERDIE